MGGRTIFSSGQENLAHAHLTWGPNQFEQPPVFQVIWRLKQLTYPWILRPSRAFRAVYSRSCIVFIPAEVYHFLLSPDHTSLRIWTYIPSWFYEYLSVQHRLLGLSAHVHHVLSENLSIGRTSRPDLPSNCRYNTTYSVSQLTYITYWLKIYWSDIHFVPISEYLSERHRLLAL